MAKKDPKKLAQQEMLRKLLHKKTITCVDLNTLDSLTLFLNDGTRVNVQTMNGQLVFTTFSNGGD